MSHPRQSPGRAGGCRCGAGRRLASTVARWVAAAAILMDGATCAAAREELETDRDSFTFAPTTTGSRTSILEASYSFIDNRSGPESHSVPEVLMRRGIGEKLGVRLGFNYEAGGPGTVSGNEFGGEDIETEDESRILYGTKVETTDQDGWLPRSSVVKVPVGERWNVHAEHFGIFSSQKREPLNIQFVSFGGHVLATDDLEIGLRVGWGLNETSPAFFSNMGIGWRY